MNPFYMMMMNPFGMGFMPFGCGCSMYSRPYERDLSFLEFPIFMDRSVDYLLDPKLALAQCQQQWRSGNYGYGGYGNIGGFGGFGGGFGNFGNVGGMTSPWWTPTSTETDEEKKAREAREAEEKEPGYIEKKAKVDEYKLYFEKLKELLDSETKDSADFKALENEYNQALKENKIDDKVKKLEDVFKKLNKETLTKIALADNAIDAALYEIGYNYPSEISKHNEGYSIKDLDGKISTLNLADSVAVGAFGPMALSTSNYILHIVSTWNDTHDASEKGIIRGIAKHMPENNNTTQQQYKAGVEGIADALIKKADDFVKANGGAKALPKLCKKIEAVRKKVEVIKKVDYSKKQFVKKSDVNALATVFDELYIALRLTEADVMNQKVVNKYGARMNALVEGAIPEDIIIKETRDDLTAEGFKNLPSADKLDKIDIKNNTIKINGSSSIMDPDKKYEGKPEEFIDDYGENGTLTEVGEDTGIYQTKGLDENGKKARYFTIEGNKLIEVKKGADGKFTPIDKTKEVKPSEIIKYDETITRIQSLDESNTIKPCEDFPAAKLPYPVYKATGANEYYAFIGNTFGKIKNCTGLSEDKTNHKVHARGTNKTLNAIKAEDLEAVDDDKIISKERKVELDKEKSDKEKQDKIDKVLATVTKEKYTFKNINTFLSGIGLEQTGVIGYYKTKAEPVMYFRYDNNPKSATYQKFVYLSDVKSISKNGIMTKTNGTTQACLEVRTAEESAKDLHDVLNKKEYQWTDPEKHLGKNVVKEDVATIERKLNSLRRYKTVGDIVSFIRAYNEESEHWWRKDPKIAASIARNTGITEAKRKEYIKLIADRVKSVVNAKNLTFDNPDDKVTLEYIANGKMTAYKYMQTGITLSTTAAELDRIIKLFLEKYDEKRAAETAQE